MLRKVVMGVALVASASTALPSVAMAKDHGHKHGHHGKHHKWDNDDRGRRYDGERRYYSDRYAEPRRYYSDSRPAYRCEKSGGTTGLILGGAAGALLGRAIDTRGERTTGTILGAGAGALLGREVAQTRRC